MQKSIFAALPHPHTERRAMRVGVIGVGHLGKHHARIYSDMNGVDLIGVCDSNPERGRAIAAEYSTEFYDNYRDLIGRIDAVSLAVPTVDHFRIAKDLLANGIAVLVEKPITFSLEEADELINIATRKRVCLQVGHLERFNPAVVAVRKILKSPRFFEGHRLSVFSARSLDIDVVMDLMIHDLDIVLSMVQAPVISVHAVGIPVITSRFDIANARIEFADGCIANLTASRISNEKVRKLRFFQPHDYISIDYIKQEVALASLKAGVKPEISAGKLPIEPGEPLRLELEAFIDSVKHNKPALVTGEDGKRALELALQVSSKIAEHARKIGLH